MKINDHLILKTEKGVWHVSERNKGKFVQYITEFPIDYKKIANLSAYQSLKECWRALTEEEQKWFWGTPIYISPNLIPIVMVDVHIFLHKFNEVLVQNRSHVDLWGRWFKIKVVPKLD